MTLPSFQEDLISRLRALGLLQNLGYEYLTRKKRTTPGAGGWAAFS
ncbi:MAG: hypothetical protein OXT71_12340 [Acidobacteriota bacterium]|nr:hypothetical protein [Acidobacteriota bacterium]